MSINKNQLGKAIRDVRKLRGLSQAALGQRAGLQGNTVALIERGQRGISIDALNELAKALDLPAACLTMLGTSQLQGDSADIGLVKSLKELILSALAAQTQLQQQERGKPVGSTAKGRSVRHKKPRAATTKASPKKGRPTKARRTISLEPA